MPRTAIFVIDIQNHIAVDPTSRVPQADRVIKASEEILQTARSIKDSNEKSNSPLIVFIQHEESANDGTLVKGTEPWELVFHPRADVEGEILVAKRTGTVPIMFDANGHSLTHLYILQGTHSNPTATSRRGCATPTSPKSSRLVCRAINALKQHVPEHWQLAST